MDEVKYNPRNHHAFKVLNTLMLLAECYAFKLKTDHACEIYDFVCDGYEQLFGTRETVLHSYSQQQKAEALFKQATERIQAPIKIGLKCA